LNTSLVFSTASYLFISLGGFSIYLGKGASDILAISYNDLIMIPFWMDWDI
jgi:hypothetical protein